MVYNPFPKTPIERVEQLMENTMSEFGQYPTAVTVLSDTYDWFSDKAIRGQDPRIRFTKDGLMFNTVRIRRHR